MTLNSSAGSDDTPDPAGQPQPEGYPSAPDASEVLRTGVPRAKDLTRDIEAMLMTSGRAVPASRLAVALGLIATEDAVGAKAVGSPEGGPGAAGPHPDEQGGEQAAKQPEERPKVRRSRKPKREAFDAEALVSDAVGILNHEYEKTGRAFRIERVGGGFKYMTLPAHAKAIGVLHGLSAQSKLSKPAIETLAIIAYKQPVTKATLEAIRGVACGEVLKTLLEKRLVTIAGRAEELGRPILYATSRAFLDAFGLGSLRDLPQPGEASGRPLSAAAAEVSATVPVGSTASAVEPQPMVVVRQAEVRSALAVGAGPGDETAAGGDADVPMSQEPG